jgi:Tol biopolymer transport system component
MPPSDDLANPDLGRLAYIQGGDLWVKVLPAGEPQRLTTDGQSLEPRWSASGEWLAFYRERQVWVMRANGQDAHAVHDGEDIEQCAWSPVEDRLGYVLTAGSLHTVRADGSERLLLAPDKLTGRVNGRVGRIAWSPDGAWIAYAWREPAGGQPKYQALWKVSTEGQTGDTPPACTELYQSGAPQKGEAILRGWTSDGAYLLFWQAPSFGAVPPPDGAPLFSLPAEGGVPLQCAEAVLVQDDSVTLDPTGSSLLAIIAGAGRETYTRKVLRGLSAAQQGGPSLSPAEVAASAPAWSADGQRLAYVTLPDQGAAPQSLGQRRLWVVEAQGGSKPVQVTNDPAYRDEHPLWSNDGSQILIARLSREGRASLWLVAVDGGATHPVVEELTPIPPDEYGHIAWGRLYAWRGGMPG